MIIFSVGIQKSGTAWYYNLTNDLLIAAGFHDAREIRRKYHLQSILRGRNCALNIKASLLPLILIPHFFGSTYAIKLHGRPRKYTRLLLATHLARATLIYRDPRDIVISLYEHSLKLRQRGKVEHPFAKVNDINEAILKTKKWLGDWDAWASRGDTLLTRYEDLVIDPIQELKRLQLHLRLIVSESTLKQIADKYRPANISQTKARYHFNQGKVGRHKSVFSPDQYALCRVCFGDTIERMGYQWDEPE